MLGAFDGVGGGDRRRLGEDMGFPSRLLDDDLDDAASLGRAEDVELAGATGREDDMNAGVDHDVDVIAQSALIDPLTVVGQRGRQCADDSLEFLFFMPSS